MAAYHGPAEGIRMQPPRWQYGIVVALFVLCLALALLVAVRGRTGSTSPSANGTPATATPLAAEPTGAATGMSMYPAETPAPVTAAYPVGSAPSVATGYGASAGLAAPTAIPTFWVPEGTVLPFRVRPPAPPGRG